MLNQSIFTPACINCGSLLVGVSLFCDLCFNGVIAPKIKNAPIHDVSRHIFLMEWNHGEELLLAQLVYRLKAGQSPQAIVFYSDLLAERLSLYWDFEEFEAIIPIPGSTANRTHSLQIAEQLSLRSGLPKWDALQKNPTAGQQKILSSSQRKLRNPFRITPNPPEEFTSAKRARGTYLFVDDVLTTGQSVKHAESILNLSKRNAVATLFYRPPHLK